MPDAGTPLRSTADVRLQVAMGIGTTPTPQSEGASGKNVLSPNVIRREETTALSTIEGLPGYEKEKEMARRERVNRAREMQKVGWVIDPRHSTYLPKWDLIMVLSLLFTVVVTPVEVAFLDEGMYITPLWIINRIVDVFFSLDIILTFNRAYQESVDNGGHWVFNKWVIARHYFRGWFTLDFVSVLPFWTISLKYAYYTCINEGYSHDTCLAREVGIDVSNITDSNEIGSMHATITRSAVLFRIMKLLRMVKLARVFKASRVLQRAVLDFVMNELEWTFAVLKMMKLFAILATFAHWQACLWGLASSYMDADDYPNWVANFRADYENEHGETPTGIDTYAAALYWSVMTLTSIGYGDVKPVNTAERLLCTAYMMASGLMWTYAIGSVTAIATTLDPNNVLYQNTMDALNYFMRERDLPRGMRMTLRDYFSNARLVMQLNDDADLLDRMSPLLQGAVALVANKRWLDHIWFFRGIETAKGGSDFIAALAKALVIRSYVAQERLPVGQLYILRRGFVVKMWRFLGSGKVWGEDVIMLNRDLVDHSQAVALTYVEAYTLRRNDLMEVLAEFPGPAKRVHKAARRMTIQRAFLRYFCKQMGKEGPRSVALKSTAKGYVTVHDTYTIEQKVDLLVERTEIDEATAKSSARLVAERAQPPGSPSRRDRSPSNSMRDGLLARKVEALASQVSELVAAQVAATAQLDSLHRRLEGGAGDRGAAAKSGAATSSAATSSTATPAPLRPSSSVVLVEARVSPRASRELMEVPGASASPGGGRVTAGAGASPGGARITGRHAVEEAGRQQEGGGSGGRRRRSGSSGANPPKT